ncbi:MAG TPA: FAD-binding oxidoreductase [Candidatus Dormibacteraeota bacterium]|nr:FAD-binding oxidoreductase [Candidatus Dormibacteraeota bacterium]
MIVGAGTVGGWASCFARQSGAERVIVVEQARIGEGASSRAAGMVRAQGGTLGTVKLGAWSIDFYRRQSAELGTDSGFRELGYLILATTAEEERAAQDRIVMQRQAGLDVRWVDAAEAAQLDSCLAPATIRGASYAPTDGCIDPVRNVRAYSLAMQRAGVEVQEGCTFVGIEEARSTRGARLTAVVTSRGRIETTRLILTGGPQLREVGERVGVRIPAGAVRHQVAVTEPHPVFQVERRAMGFDLSGGLYWRLEEGGLLFGMSNPDERPGIARVLDWDYMTAMRRRLATFLPVTERLQLRKAWAATIDYTPDHQPILGQALQRDEYVIEGVTVASPGGHGMMWGPAVARIAADLALTGKTSLTDVSGWGLDRFDEQGRSRLATDPIALPFPTETAIGTATR